MRINFVYAETHIHTLCASPRFVVRVQTFSGADVGNPWLDATPRAASAAPGSALVELSVRGAPELPSLALHGS